MKRRPVPTRWVGAAVWAVAHLASAQTPATAPPEPPNAGAPLVDSPFLPSTAAPLPGPPGLDPTEAAAAAGGETDAATLLEAQIRQNEALAASRRQSIIWGGYIDFGFFAPEGNGAGYVQDVLHRYPGYPGTEWVFLGDILAPAVNSRGEAADLGDAPGVNRYDSIHSRGAFGFIVNELNLRLRATPSPTAILSASLNFTPRTGSNFSLGDMFDLDIAQLEWLPTESQRTSIFVGKIESVLGIEYRDRKSDQRFGVTPSLIARYTTGTALGLKVRSKFGPDDCIVLAVAVTNGSNTTEQFFFYDEVDSNDGKTVSGRLSFRLPLLESIEIGGSGSWGSADRTTSNKHTMWFAGPDLIAHLGPVDVKAQWLKGHSGGDATQNLYSLDLHGGGYLELDAMLTSSFGVMGRGEYRSADITLPPQRAYVSRSWRATAGVRWTISTWAVLKAEYLHNGEYGNIPQISDDVFTSSLVLSY
ncbi:MAG TPA: hypothetical protein VNO55_28500 [Polyangia bacterium]|nr:hypothetical protein [Polyangia bacterium]